MIIKDFLKDVPSDLLTEETLVSLETAFNNRVKLHVEKALVEQDELYAKKLETLIEAIDTDHSKKLNNVVKAIDKNNTTKLKTVISKYEKDLNKNAKTFKESLINSISNYLEVYLEEVVPAAEIKQAVKNKQAYSVLDGLRKTLAVDSALMKESVREAVIEGKTQLNKYETTVEKLAKQNNLLTAELNTFKAGAILEQKTANMPTTKREYLKKILQGKSEKFIIENFDYTSKLFDKKETERVNILKEEAFASRKVKQDAPRIVEEKIKPTKDLPVKSYLNELSRIK